MSRHYTTSISNALVTSGYYLFPTLCSAQEVNCALADLETMRSRRTLLDDDHPSETWCEVDIPLSSRLANTVLDSPTKQQIQEEFGTIQSAVFWANVYHVGEYIPHHTDTEGDVQLILPIVLPPDQCGGRLRLHKHNFVEPVPERVGQRLLFRATETVHETTEVVRSLRCCDPVRIVCVCRMFVSSR